MSSLVPVLSTDDSTLCVCTLLLVHFFLDSFRSFNSHIKSNMQTHPACIKILFLNSSAKVAKNKSYLKCFTFLIIISFIFGFLWPKIYLLMKTVLISHSHTSALHKKTGFTFPLCLKPQNT